MQKTAEAQVTDLVTVRFEPDEIEVQAPHGALVTSVAAGGGCPVETPCGGMGTCGKCRIIVRDGVSEPDDTEKRMLSESDLNDGVRLACRTRIVADAVITLPETSRSLVQKILSTGVDREVTVDSNIRKIHAKMPEPTLEDERAEFERLAESIGIEASRLTVDLHITRKLSSVLRSSDYDVTAVIGDSELLDVEPSDTTSLKYGVAFDLGSTTIVGYLLDLHTGAEVSVASGQNPQMSYGDDLISRINHAASPNGLSQLTHAVIDAMNLILKRLTTSAGIQQDDLYEATVVGNSCMTHILLGIDPSSLGQSPYVPSICRHISVRCAELGLRMNPRGLVHVLPNVAGFVGSDLVGVLLAGMWDDDGRTRLAIDIGTNGEMALRHNGRTLACSAAAGPAFEGARITYGMRGGPGAIDSVTIDDDVIISTIENRRAKGICGSGLVDAVAEMLKAGLIDEMGRIIDPDEAAELPPAVRNRLILVDGIPQFVLVDERHSATGQPITLFQRDIRQLQLAKGSIRAAIQTLLKIAGADESDITEMLLAGAFGNYIRKESAVRIGLAPDIPIERITSVGNAAGAGAKLALLSVRERELAQRLADSTEHIELANHPDYQNEFMERMLFPCPENGR